jgi:hypothetical protein
MVDLRGAVAAFVAVALSGCSIIAVRGAPDQLVPNTPPDCTTSKLMVYADGAIAAGAVGTSLFIGLAALANSDKREQLGYATLFTFLGSIPFLVSGIIGGVRVNSCRKAHEQFRMMMQPQPYYGPPAPYPYPPPQSGPPGGA